MTYKTIPGGFFSLLCGDWYKLTWRITNHFWTNWSGTERCRVNCKYNYNNKKTCAAWTLFRVQMSETHWQGEASETVWSTNNDSIVIKCAMLNVETNAKNPWNICNSFGIKRMRRRFSTKNDLIPFLNVQFTKNTESTIYKNFF